MHHFFLFFLHKKHTSMSCVDGSVGRRSINGLEQCRAFHADLLQHARAAPWFFHFQAGLAPKKPEQGIDLGHGAARKSYEQRYCVVHRVPDLQLMIPAYEEALSVLLAPLRRKGDKSQSKRDPHQVIVNNRRPHKTRFGVNEMLRAVCFDHKEEQRFLCERVFLVTGNTLKHAEHCGGGIFCHLCDRDQLIGRVVSEEEPSAVFQRKLVAFLGRKKRDRAVVVRKHHEKFVACHRSKSYGSESFRVLCTCTEDQPPEKIGATML